MEIQIVKTNWKYDCENLLNVLNLQKFSWIILNFPIYF